MLKLLIKIMLAISLASACSERKQINEPVPGPVYDSLMIGTPHLRPGKVFVWADTVVQWSSWIHRPLSLSTINRGGDPMPDFIDLDDLTSLLRQWRKALEYYQAESRRWKRRGHILFMRDADHKANELATRILQLEAAIGIHEGPVGEVVEAEA